MHVKHLLMAEGEDAGGGSLLASAAVEETPPAAVEEGAASEAPVETTTDAPAPEAAVPEGPAKDEATGRWLDVPAKFWDPEAKALRVDERGLPIGLLKAHRELEKRFGEIPGDVAGYKLQLAEGEQLGVTDADAAPFAEKAHELGLSNTQYNALVRVHLQEASRIAGLVAEQSIEQAKTALVQHYGSEAAMTAELRDAYRVFEQFADPAEMAAIDSLGNNAIAVRVLAKIGKALKEDAAPNSMATVDTDLEVEKLYRDKSSPYWNQSMAGHEDAKRRVTEWHQRRFPTGVRR